jgi:glutaredoxin-related protein
MKVNIKNFLKKETYDQAFDHSKRESKILISVIYSRDNINSINYCK